MERYVCVHGHFYQPPRENAWLEAIELQDSAYPFHDWNERITAECYAPNAASRILDPEGKIADIVNNYASISFNFGPTLLAWIQFAAPNVCEALRRADEQSRERFSGHGSAMAQAYSHMILPLANRADKYTQVLWGIRDFQHRFGRMPEGMWLPETAVNTEVLDVLAELGIAFTVLAPGQAGKVRSLDGEQWDDVSGAQVDPSRAYLCRLPSGRSINLFFYDGPVAQAVAFEKLLERGDLLANRLLGAFGDERSWPQLVHIATDGETYGHHQAFGDMALAHALRFIDGQEGITLTNYGEYLERHPPTYEVEIIDNTSWSCAHGVERWRSNCGCNTGMHPGWHQEWRAPLRESMDWLRDTLIPKYEEGARPLLKDPWEARNVYIDVILDRSDENLDRFFHDQGAKRLNEEEKVRTLQLLELQRHAMLMYTSCGWFFDELSGIETVQVIQYAGRALQLAEELFHESLEPAFLDRLEAAKSNLPEHRDGRRVYDRFVKPAMIDLLRVGAHYAVSAPFEDGGGQARSIYSYSVDRRDYHRITRGRTSLTVGQIGVTSDITRASLILDFGVLHMGDHHINAGVRTAEGEEAYQAMLEEVKQAIEGAEFADIIRLLDKYFGSASYSLKSLFRDQQRRIVDRIIEESLHVVETDYHMLYERYAPWIDLLIDLGIPIPETFRVTGEITVNAQLRSVFDEDEFPIDRASSLVQEAIRRQVPLDEAGLGLAASWMMERMADQLRDEPDNLDYLQELERTAEFVVSLPFSVNLWEVQNRYHQMLQSHYPERLHDSESGDEDAVAWLESFRSLGQLLRMPVESMVSLRIPSATYRFQFSRDFRFEDARRLVSYLQDLGISDVYASPLFKARTGSSHGYDVTEFSRLNPELGSEEDFDALGRALHVREMGLLLDIVPNHMAASVENPWWRDVLEHGVSSPYISFFDIRRDVGASPAQDRILLPILGARYGEVLDRGDLALEFGSQGFFVSYGPVEIPLDPKTYLDILESPPGVEEARSHLGEEARHILQKVIADLKGMPDREAADPDAVGRRRGLSAQDTAILWERYERDPDFKAFIDASLRALNGRLGNPRSFDSLDQLLSKQTYRLAYWKTADEQLNYGRFFNISDLIRLRAEDPRVFQETHALAFRLIQEGKVTGLRVDHVDGLRDPTGYLYRLQSRLADYAAAEGGAPGFYVLVEKILGHDEPLPRQWPVCGTTGYEFIQSLASVFLDTDGMQRLDALYRRFTGSPRDFDDVVYEKMKYVMGVLFMGEFRSLQNELRRLAVGDRYASDLSVGELGRALREVTACMSVYRTYIRGQRVFEPDRSHIRAAAGRARRRNAPSLAPALDFLQRVLLLDLPATASQEERQARLEFVLNWQQFTSPIVAKGVEDTALYVYNRLVSLNEVGVNPDIVDRQIDWFHERNLYRARHWPASLNTTSTHDTKRSEDVRARINVLSELAEEWEERLMRWSAWNRDKGRKVRGHIVPDPNEEILVYQTLLGAWPLDEEEVPAFRGRLKEYMLKAAHEAKVFTSWSRPDRAHDKALERFVDRILEVAAGEPFMQDFMEFNARIAFYGALNSLGQVLLKATSPGVPDFYRGTELWDFSLVDPDNRRPVDFQRRMGMLEDIQARESEDLPGLIVELLDDWKSGAIKQYLIYRTLTYRRLHRALFKNGEYLSVYAAGRKEEHVCAFMRRMEKSWALVVVPRLLTRLVEPGEMPTGAGPWQGTLLLLPAEAPREWTNILTGQALSLDVTSGGQKAVPLSDVLMEFPVALLEGQLVELRPPAPPGRVA